jgi:hypothetical protein
LDLSTGIDFGCWMASPIELRNPAAPAGPPANEADDATRQFAAKIHFHVELFIRYPFNPTCALANAALLDRGIFTETLNLLHPS